MEFKEPIKLPDYVLVGDEYLTSGGWKVRIVYITQNRYFAYAIHRPDTKEESSPETHKGDGSYVSFFSKGFFIGDLDEQVRKNISIQFDKKVSN